jgi:hypothetical protein
VPTDTLPGEPLPARSAPRKNAWARTASHSVVTWVRKEPATTEALILVFIALGIAFGWWQWSGAQTGAVVGITAALLGMFVRAQVTPLVQPTARGRRLIPAPDEPDVAPVPPPAP